MRVPAAVLTGALFSTALIAALPAAQAAPPAAPVPAG